MKRVMCLVLVLALAWGSLGCYTMKHTIGTGPQTGVESSDRQWYILWGLVPLGRVDGGDIAGGAQNYRITTKIGVVDIVLNIFTGLFSIYSQTVIVER